jgi:hypothetical protein
MGAARPEWEGKSIAWALGALRRGEPRERISAALTTGGWREDHAEWVVSQAAVRLSRRRWVALACTAAPGVAVLPLLVVAHLTWVVCLDASGSISKSNLVRPTELLGKSPRQLHQVLGEPVRTGIGTACGGSGRRWQYEHFEYRPRVAARTHALVWVTATYAPSDGPEGLEARAVCVDIPGSVLAGTHFVVNTAVLPRNPHELARATGLPNSGLPVGDAEDWWGYAYSAVLPGGRSGRVIMEFEPECYGARCTCYLTTADVAALEGTLSRVSAWETIGHDGRFLRGAAPASRVQVIWRAGRP